MRNCGSAHLTKHQGDEFDLRDSLISLTDEGFEGISVVATWVMDAAAIISLIVIGFATVLYFTGQGIENHATWARVVAMLISVIIVLISLGAMTAVPRHLLPVPILTVVASSYTFWVLGWKFS